MVCTEGVATINIEDNGDGTRSMRSANNQKLLVTFRSENQVECDSLLYWTPYYYNKKSRNNFAERSIY